MKRHLLFAMLCIVGALNMNAQTWTASAVGAGQFYLYNVGAEAYLVPGNNWGTRASVNPVGGTTLTLAASGDGYTISTAPLFSGNYLGQDGYMDNPTAFAWVFEPVSGETNVYKMKNGSNYFYADAGATTTSIGSDPGTDYSKWKLVSKADRIADLASATETNPKDATFLITCPNFDRNANTGVWSMQASNKNLSGGTNENRCAESWRATFTLTQTLSSIPNGYYQVRAQAALTDYDNVGNNFPYVYAADKTADFNLMQHGENSMNQLSDRFLNGEYWTNWTASTIVSNGSLAVGVKCTRNNTWSIWDNFQLRYLGPVTDLSAYEALLADAVAAANSLNGLIPSAAYNALDAVVSANNQTYSTAADYETAITNINTAIATYGSDAMKVAYANYKAAVAQANQFASVTVTAETQATKDANTATLNSTLSGISTTVEAVTTDVSAVTAQTPNVKQAALAYITGLAPTTTTDFDLTFIITNPNFDTNNNGWTTTTGAQNNTITTNMGGFSNYPIWENWNPSAYTGKMYQSISGLPAGLYEFTLWAGVNNFAGNGQETQYVYAGSNKTYLTTDAATQYTVSDIQVVDGTLEFGFEQTSATANWVCIDQATLRYVGPFTDLSPFIDAWMTALTNARNTAALNDKMATWVRNDLNSAISANDETHVDQNSQAALEAATAALIAANELGQKSIASYKVIAAGSVPDDSLEGWTCTTFVDGQDVRFQVNTWSTEGNSDGSNMKTPFIENWTPGGNLLGVGKVYYRLEGLEPGEIYRVSCLVRSYNEASSDAPNGPNFYVNSDVADLTQVGTTFTYNNMSGIYGTQVAAATIGQDGVLELGVEVASDRNYNWVAFKNVKIETFDAAYDEAVAAVQALNGTVPASVYATASATIPATRPTTANDFMTAIDAMEQAVTDATLFVAPYEAWNTAKSDATVALANNATFNSIITNLTNEVEAATTVETVTNATTQLNDLLVPAKAYLELKDYADALVLVDNDNSSANTTLANAISDAETDITYATTAADVTTVNGALRDAMDTYAAVANPVGNGAKFNLTYKFVNPNLEGLPTWQGCDGWYTEQPDGNSQVMTNDAATSADGFKTAFYEYWSYTAKSNNLFTLYQPVTLAEGYYEMSCYAFAKQQDDPANTGDVKGVFFYANDTQGTVVDTDRLSQKNIEFKNRVNQEVKIGLKAINPNSYNWMGIGYLELYKIPSKSLVIDPDDGDDYDYTTEGAYDVTLYRPIKAGWNTIVLPFSMTQEEVENAFGQESQVSVVKYYNNDNERLGFTKQDGIIANRPCLLNATQAWGDANNPYEFLFEGRTLVAAESLYPSHESDGAKFIGTYETQTDVPQYNWLVQGGNLVYAPDDNSCFVGMTRAYLELEGWAPDSNGAKNLTITFDDGTTGIAVFENGEMNILTGKIFDLSGREVKSPTKGVYIIDGKKVMIK